MPFMTEEIWQHLPHEGQTVMLASWPTANTSLIDEAAEARMNALIDMVRGIRNVRIEYNVDPGRRIKAVITPGSYRTELENYSYVFTRLCHVNEVELINGPAPADSAAIVVNDATVYLPLAGLVDIAAECRRLQKEQEKLQQQIQRSQGMLHNENFVSRAKPEVVERERQNLTELEASATQIAGRIASLCDS
jgi:valyl-tRNA synthetase